MSFNMINANVPIAENDLKSQKSWFNFFTNIYSAVVNGISDPAVAITVSASPFSYAALRAGNTIVNGGTVSAISISRDGTTFYVTGQTFGVFPMAQNDLLKVTYTVAPTITFLPI